MKVRGKIYILAFGENSPFYCFCGIPLSDNGHWLFLIAHLSVCYFSFIIWICVYFSFQRLNFCAASESFQILLVYFSVWLKWWMVFFLLLLLFNQSTPTLLVFISVLCVWLYVWCLFLLQSQCWTSFLTVVNSAPDSVSCLPAPSTEFLNVCISYSLTANV